MLSSIILCLFLPGFHLSATVVSSQAGQSKGAYNVAVMFDRCRITSCSCTCGAGAKWCAHVVALCLFRIHNVSLCLHKGNLSNFHHQWISFYQQKTKSTTGCFGPNIIIIRWGSGSKLKFMMYTYYSLADLSQTYRGYDVIWEHETCYLCARLIMALGLSAPFSHYKGCISSWQSCYFYKNSVEWLLDQQHDYSLPVIKHVVVCTLSVKNVKTLYKICILVESCV